MTSDSTPDTEYPARQVLLADTETVIRAIVEEEWLPEANRGSPSIFRRPNTSVTRIDRIGLDSAIVVVKRDVERPGRPERDVRGVGQITVSLLKIIGRSPVPVPKPGDCIYLQVWEEKVRAQGDHPGNEDHAEIVAYDDESHLVERRSKISLGYSRMLSKALHIYAVDADGAVIGESAPLNWSTADEGSK
ncbi:hypothetical protein [Pseudomonas lundensis]|uniref:hypothetical protein n=1 Tax=Pseudomonas lundensis TaxID=86185 RepID=UPI000BA1DEC3|nr:hypothetical protein [Pseudomonas lundensis]OZY32555.1 hypothetical protein CJF36_12025 [Pseudomonas lundensis]